MVQVPSSRLPYIELKAALVEGKSNRGNLLLVSDHRPWKVDGDPGERTMFQAGQGTAL